jgi:hypothetical protein|tara:strand:+ start:5607 stop:6035 length:429 start_codon:yes stop_codon:yes gene_type:complete
MLLDDIGDILSTGGIGTVASTEDWGIFYGFLPPSPDRAVAIFETAGNESIRAMSSGPGEAPAEQPRFQVRVRGEVYDYVEARRKARDCFNLLDQLGGVTVNATRYLWVSALQSPFALGLDDNNRPSVVCNFSVVKGLSTDTG